MQPGTALIIGAGPAGCSAAIHLARCSWQVTLIEAKAFPRVKVCGEFISPAATDDLELLLDPPALRKAGARQVDQFVLKYGAHTTAWPMPSPAWALSRASLDTLLVEHAGRAGVTVLQPKRVTSAHTDPESAEVVLATGEHLHADILIHADGSGRFDDAGPTTMAPNLIGAKCHYQTTARPMGVRIRSAPGMYVGTINVEHGLATCALCTTKSLARRFAGDFDALLGSIMPDFCPDLRQSPWLATGIARMPFRPSPSARAFRIGNAAGAVDPVGGEGIGLGLWAGRTLAETLESCASLEETKRRFARLYRRRLRSRRVACRLAAETLMRPGLLRTLRPALAAPSLSIAPWYALTGKPIRSSNRGT